MAAKFVQSHLAKLLIHYRERRGLTKAEAVWFLGTSKDILEAYESGTRQYMEPHIVEGWLRDYGAPEEVILQAKEHARWIRFGDPARMQENIPPWFSRFVELEASATTIDIYEDSLITGLGQTPGYAKALLGSSPLLAANSLPKTLTLRAQRQVSVLNRDGGPPQLRVIQTEQSITRLKGSELFDPQIDWLSELDEREEIDIFILPANIIHAAMGMSFMIMTFGGNEPDVMYQENMFGAQYDTEAGRVNQGRTVFSATLPLVIRLGEWRDSNADN